MDLVGTGEGKSNNTKREGEEEEEEENNNTLNDYITGFRVLVLQHTRPFDAAISRGRPSVRPSVWKRTARIRKHSIRGTFDPEIKTSALHSKTFSPFFRIF